MLQPTFIVINPSGFSKLKCTSKDSLSEQYFYSKKWLFVSEATALYPVAAVSSLQFKSFSHPSKETESHSRSLHLTQWMTQSCKM